MVGTTESAFDDNPDVSAPLESEIEYLKRIYTRHFPDRDVTVINQWAGQRVLPSADGAAFKRTRETMLPVDNANRPRLISIFGGKLTGYRATADKVMKLLNRTLPARTAAADTRQLPLADPAKASPSTTGKNPG